MTRDTQQSISPRAPDNSCLSLSLCERRGCPKPSCVVPSSYDVVVAGSYVPAVPSVFCGVIVVRKALDASRGRSLSSALMWSQQYPNMGSGGGVGLFATDDVAAARFRPAGGSRPLSRVCPDTLTELMTAFRISLDTVVPVDVYHLRASMSRTFCHQNRARRLIVTSLRAAPASSARTCSPSVLRMDKRVFSPLSGAEGPVCALRGRHTLSPAGHMRR